MRKDLEGLHEYYVPNGTYDAIKYSNDKWIFTSDVNVNNPNSSSTPKIGNPKMYEYLTTVGIPDGNGNYIKMNPVP